MQGFLQVYISGFLLLCSCYSGSTLLVSAFSEVVMQAVLLPDQTITTSMHSELLQCCACSNLW